VTRRTLTASVLTYAVALMMTIALPMTALTFFSFVAVWLFSGLVNQPTLEAVAILIFGLIACTNPLATAVLTEIVIQQKNSVFVFSQTLSNGVSIPLPSPWIVYTILYILLTVWLVWLSVRTVRKVDT
jgi:glucan phosphoethanolaminetransferase (alkaline phosphatase superfamily)